MWVSAAPTELLILLFSVSPGFHIGLCPHFTLGFAGVSPLQGSFHSFICVYPGFHIGLCPHFTLGYAGVPPFQGSLSYWACVPRVSYRALPLFHPGLCRSVALTGLFVILGVCTQGFISGFALIPPWALQECRPCRALCRIERLWCCVVVLCSLNVLWCVNGLLHSFVFLYLIVLFVVLGDCCCVRAMSPKGAILLHSPGRKPWVNHWNIFIEPR